MKLEFKCTFTDNCFYIKKKNRRIALIILIYSYYRFTDLEDNLFQECLK